MDNSKNLQASEEFPKSSKITYNIGGKIFTTFRATITKYPDTTLARALANPNMNKPDEKGNYFWDRNGTLFEYILDYYRTGKIVYPKLISEEDFHRELEYWGLPVPDLKLRFKDIVDTDHLDRTLSMFQYYALNNQSYKYDYMHIAVLIINTIVTNIRSYLDGNTNSEILPYDKEFPITMYAEIMMKVQSCLKTGKLHLTVLELPSGDSNPGHTKYSYTENGKRKVRKVTFSLE